MGEIADDLIDRMIDDGYFPGSNFTPTGRHKKPYNPPIHRLPKERDLRAFSDEVRAAEYPSKKTDPNLLPKYEEKTFDMSFFPTIPKKEPKKPEPSGWDSDPDEAPF